MVCQYLDVRTMHAPALLLSLLHGKPKELVVGDDFCLVGPRLGVDLENLEVKAASIGVSPVSDHVMLAADVITTFAAGAGW